MPKMLTYRQISQVSQAKSNWFVFSETVAHNIQGRVVLHIPDMNRVELKVSLATTMHSYGVRVLSSVIIIDQSDTRNIEYVTV